MLHEGFREGEAWSGRGPAEGAITYPQQYFVHAYVRSAVGLVVAFGVWYAIPATTTASLICAGVATAFVLYAIQIRLRQSTRVEWDGEGIEVSGPRPWTLPWTEIRAVRLSYFSTRRDGEKGWMQLKISGKPGALRLDSDAAGFAQLVIASLYHADRLGLDVTATTRHNAAVLVGPGGFRPS